VGNASSLLSVCPCVQVKEFNTVAYRGCRVVIVVGKVPTERWAGQCSQSGRSGDRIPVEARFSASVQTGPETHPASCTMGSEVGVATAYELDGPGIESRWERDFPHLSRPALEPTQPPV